jgi:sulfide dehydrogenase [flavocytochrome c] flavoprotein subunit
VAPRVHLIGDSIAGSPGMPKSGHMANQQAKVCAAAVAALLADQPPVAQPIFANTCYSFVSDNEAAHVASVYRYSAEKRFMAPVKEATGVSDRPSVAEAIYAMAWAGNIMSDTMG